MQKVKMIAQGRVQGVGFRWGVYTLALELGESLVVSGTMMTEPLKFLPKQSLQLSWLSSSKRFEKDLLPSQK